MRLGLGLCRAPLLGWPAISTSSCAEVRRLHGCGEVPRPLARRLQADWRDLDLVSGIYVDMLARYFARIVALDEHSTPMASS